MLSFRAYIRQRRITDDLIGDFVRDARHDTALPDVQSWPSLRDYLRDLRAPDGAFTAARKLWLAYRRAAIRWRKVGATKACRDGDGI